MKESLHGVNLYLSVKLLCCGDGFEHLGHHNNTVLVILCEEVSKDGNVSWLWSQFVVDFLVIPLLCLRRIFAESTLTGFARFMQQYVDLSSRAVYGVGLRPLACWDCGFEYRRGHGCLFLVSVVCCQVEVSATS